MKSRIIVVLCSCFCLLAFSAVGGRAESKKAGANALKGVVQDGAGQAIEKAAVYLIPAADVEAMGKTRIDVKKNSPNDEPLEDNLAANIDNYKNGTTDRKGSFSVTGVPDGKYFIYVMPDGQRYLPGGDKANKSISAKEFQGKTIKIQLSGSTPDNAVYVGSSKCLTCHPAYESLKKTLHKLGI